MPELPEVETYRRDMERLVGGRTITRVFVDWPRQVAAPSPAKFKREIAGRKIVSVGRRGKYLIFGLTGGYSMIVHLRMTGRLHLVAPDCPPDRHSHVTWTLDTGMELRFQDPRKFGKVYLVGDPDEIVGRLGPEPFDKKLTAARLVRMVAGKKTALKPLLLNQEFIAGLGNIYVDETLHLSGIHPRRAAGSLSADEARKLLSSIRTVLRKAIRHNGTSFDPFYVDAFGRPGRYQKYLRVYGRHGRECLKCGRTIDRIVVAQRGTHVCHACQPRPRKRG